jgi:DNA recombination protein RmuC
MATLRTVAHLWRQDQQNKNAMEIARQCANLYDKFVGFVEDLEQIGKRLDQAHSCYHDAFNKLKSGKVNLIKAAERVKELGVKPSKTIANNHLNLNDEH